MKIMKKRKGDKIMFTFMQFLMPIQIQEADIIGQN
jgi:hypothetical protein